ncbi:MAG: NHL repeat-containing protein [Planctomycetota bacterium]|nr:NHL repeat-containing protein [Planctomycetota bacterium]
MRPPLSIALALALASAAHGQVLANLITAAGDGQGNTLNDPRDVVGDHAGNVYVCGLISNNLFKVAPDGTVTELLDKDGVAGLKIQSPEAVEVDAQGNVYLASTGNHVVFKVEPDGTASVLLDATGGGVAPMFEPAGMVMGPNNVLYIAARGSNNVFAVDSVGNVDVVMDATGDGATALSGPVGLDFDANGNLYVLGFYSYNLFRKLAIDGTVELLLEDGPVELLCPDVMAVQDDGTILVGTQCNQRLYRREVDGTVTLEMDKWIGQVISEGNHFYITLPLLHRARRLKLNGTHAVRLIDIDGDGLGNQLGCPRGMDLAPTGQLIVAGGCTHTAFRIKVGGFVGTSYCGPAELNSANLRAVIYGLGTHKAEWNTITVNAVLMPTNKFGMFINSVDTGFVAPPGSQGNLCLGGSIGRHNQDILLTGASGSFSLELDLTAVPTPGGPYAILAGEEWHWQAWYRDNNPGPTSNLTNGLRIHFE